MGTIAQSTRLSPRSIACVDSRALPPDLRRDDQRGSRHRGGGPSIAPDDSVPAPRGLVLRPELRALLPMVDRPSVARSLHHFLSCGARLEHAPVRLDHRSALAFDHSRNDAGTGVVGARHPRGVCHRCHALSQLASAFAKRGAGVVENHRRREPVIPSQITSRSAGDAQMTFLHPKRIV
jgi:hypothetical protein